MPEIVATDDKGYKSIPYSKMAALFLESFKELQAQNKAQQVEIENLKRRLNAIQ